MQQIHGLQGFPDPISTHPRTVAVHSLVDNLVRMNTQFHIAFRGVAFLIHVCMPKGCATHAFGTNSREGDDEIGHMDQCVDIVRRTRPFRFAFSGPVICPPDGHPIYETPAAGSRDWVTRKCDEWDKISRDLKETVEHPEINELREIVGFGANVRGDTWLVERHAKQIPFDDDERTFKVDHSYLKPPRVWPDIKEGSRSESAELARKMRDLLVEETG